jgi:hypothetical protein
MRMAGSDWRGGGRESVFMGGGGGRRSIDRLSRPARLIGWSGAGWLACVLAKAEGRGGGRGGGQHVEWHWSIDLSAGD